MSLEGYPHEECLVRVPAGGIPVSRAELPNLHLDRERESHRFKRRGRIRAPENAVGFGSSTWLSGAALIGALPEYEFDQESGAAYVYRYDGEVWVEEARLIASDFERLGRFGVAVAIRGDTAVIGARGKRSRLFRGGQPTFSASTATHGSSRQSSSHPTARRASISAFQLPSESIRW